ncbi:MAG: nucleotidyltransferase domain-containing protein [Patescibacteria group bacterium]
MKKGELTKKLKPVFELYPQIKLVYLFGSIIRGETGPMSDYDFAVYLDEKNKEKISETKLSLIDKISIILKTDKIDIVTLNTPENTELKYNIIKDGELIYEEEPFRIFVEPRILNEYFDFHFLLKKYGLTKA